MDYSIFKEVIKEGILERFDDINIEIKEITKNNGIILDGMIISKKDSKISPTFYLNDFYESFNNGTDLDTIIDTICNAYAEHENDFEFDVCSFENFDDVKSRIMYRLVNTRLNSGILDTIPHREYLDLSIVYYVLVKDINFENGSILINNSHMEMWGTDEDTLFELAGINTQQNFKVDLMSMYDMLTELMIKRGEDEDAVMEMLKPMDDKMFVLTNESRHYGAACLIYKDVISDFSKKNDCDVIVIPSSIHELILIGRNEEESLDAFNEMVTEVNATQLLPQEILSDHVYIYDRKEGCIKMS